MVMLLGLFPQSGKIQVLETGYFHSDFIEIGFI